MGANRTATEISQISNATQQILPTTVDNSKYCFTFTLVFWIVTFSLVFKIPHRERSSVMTFCLLHFGSNGTTHVLPQPHATLTGQSTLGLWSPQRSPPAASSPADCKQNCLRSIMTQVILCVAFVAEDLPLGPKQVFFIRASLLSLTAYLPILCSKCEVFEAGNFFLKIVLLIKPLFLTALNIFWIPMHSNTSGCRQFLWYELWAVMIF